jgi:quercetin dioxygenase-like cupin family protein
MEMFVKNKDVKSEEIAPGVTRKIMGYQSDLMVIRVTFDGDTSFPSHQHPHQQITHIIEGKFKATIDGKSEMLGPGDSYVVPGDVMHSVECFGSGVLIDVFSPRRDDFLTDKKESGY